jgi:hypothetical protein
MTPKMGYKFLKTWGRTPYSGNDFSRFLPRGNKKGKWLPNVNPDILPLKLCARGYHYCRTKSDIISWIRGRIIKEINVFRIEIHEKAKILNGPDKSCASQIRFLKKLKVRRDRHGRIKLV